MNLDSKLREKIKSIYAEHNVEISKQSVANKLQVSNAVLRQKKS